jgi:hypothetical protein
VSGWAILSLGVGAIVAALLAVGLLRRPPRPLIKESHAGRPVPAVLGLALVPAVGAGFAAGAVADPQAVDALTASLLVWMGAVAAAGFVDDVAGRGPRGIGGHLASLARGRPTTGIVKLAVGLAGAWFVSRLLPGDEVHRSAGFVLIAVCTNLWNALDVRPGRAVKWGAVALAPVAAVGPAWPPDPLVAAAFGAAVGVLPFDLAERGMLGDAGSNPLGLVTGAGLAAVLPTAGVLVAAVVALGLQVAAETITISRLIEASPPLRWFDRLGRRS